jgi:DNA-binding response OmpR family regulator
VGVVEAEQKSRTLVVEDEAEQKSRILVIEDEEAIQRGLCDVLAYHGHAPTAVGDGKEGLARALAEHHDLVLLDVMLPGLSGLDVCSRLRAEKPDQPILMLTARGSEADVLEGFERGADDYVTKPFSVSELLARVKALLRRSRSEGSEPAQAARFGFGDWQVDAAALRATRGGCSVDLSPREVQILALLAREAGRVVSRRLLLREIWGFAHPENIETRTVDMQIGKLRRKIDGESGSWIETVRGAGYRYAGAPS